MTMNMMQRIAGLALACALLVACGDDSSTGGSGSGGDGAGSGGDGGSPRTVSLSGSVHEFTLGLKPGEFGPALAGVEVCVDDDKDIDCDTTDADGAFSLKGLQPNTEATFRFTKDGYLGVLLPGRTPFENFAGFTTALASDSVVTGFAAIVSTTYPNADQGVVTVFVAEPFEPDGGATTTFIPDATFELLSGTGKGPNYVTEAQVPDLKLSATTKGGWGFFYEVEPGTIEIEVKAGSLDCRPGWSMDATNKAKVPVKASLQTTLTFTCE